MVSEKEEVGHALAGTPGFQEAKGSVPLLSVLGGLKAFSSQPTMPQRVPSPTIFIQTV